jgi:hypothetical protein
MQPAASVSLAARRPWPWLLLRRHPRFMQLTPRGFGRPSRQTLHVCASRRRRPLRASFSRGVVQEFPSIDWIEARPLPVGPKPFLRRRSAKTSARSALAVLPGFDGFLRASTCRFVAPCCRPWGSPRFGHELRVHGPVLPARAAVSRVAIAGPIPLGTVAQPWLASLAPRGRALRPPGSGLPAPGTAAPGSSHVVYAVSVAVTGRARFHVRPYARLGCRPLTLPSVALLPRTWAGALDESGLESVSYLPLWRLALRSFLLASSRAASPRPLPSRHFDPSARSVSPHRVRRSGGPMALLH